MSSAKVADFAEPLALADKAVSEPNYSIDEKEIKDYSDSERYKETDLTPGSTIVENLNTGEGVEKDGFKFDTLNPSATSPSKTEYGYEVVIDKKTGQRTYTKVVVSDSGLIPVDAGDKPMMGEGEKLTPESPAVTYKPNEDGEITGSRKQKSYEYEASAETLKHINNIENDSTIIGMKGNYNKDNTNGNQHFKGDNFFITYKVNPWPNENDNLEELKLNKNKYDPTSKYFVKCQDIDTGIKVDNVDGNAKERLVGQVYNPITGEIVPGASAYIGDDGNIHIKLPDGALKKDDSGKTVINEDSIFNTPEQPGKPGKPNEVGEKPDQPSKPEDPKLEKPESPDKTETPDKAENPKKKDEGVRIDFAPKKSEKTKESQKDNKSNRAPKTGVSGTSGVILTSLGATSSLFASKKKKKNNK